MKINVSLAIVASFALFAANLAQAENATKDECIAKVKEAAEMIKKDGLDAALAEIDKKDGKFVWKDSYLFAMNLEGKCLAHPMNPELKDRPTIAVLKDVNGKAFISEMLSVGKDKGEGWVDYFWTKPGATEPSPKSSYVYKVPDVDVMVGAGVYPE